VHGPLPHWADNEDRGTGGRPGQFSALPPLGALLADKAFDSDGLRKELQVRGAPAVISPKGNRKNRRSSDREACK